MERGQGRKGEGEKKPKSSYLSISQMIIYKLAYNLQIFSHSYVTSAKRFADSSNSLSCAFRRRCPGLRLGRR